LANLFEHKDRRVVPNWRSFGRSIVLGELNSFQIERTEPLEETSIEDYVIDFKINKTIIHASDLLSAAIVNDHRDHEVVISAAKFILKNSEKATKSQISLSQKILNNSPEKDISLKFKEVGISNYSAIINPFPLYEKIRATKELLRLYPNNAILYVELSRYYSILGQEKSSIQSMKIALHIAPHNRFVLRSATRLFAHYNTVQNNYLDYIHRVLKNSPLTPIDPWLASAEISISTIKGQNSKFLKKGMNLLNSKNISPFNFTELASSLGTVELINGSSRKSRDFFNKSLISPNDNTLAQIEWASTKDNRIEITQDNYNLAINFEALALDNYQNKEYEIALDNAIKWLSDQPYSKRPVMFGSNLASTIMKDQDKAIAIINAGLISHPYDPQLLNNLAYSLALEGKPNEALTELEKLKGKTNIDASTQICITATRGLAYFRLGQIDLGRHLYLEAIKKTKSISNQNLNWIAILNYAREELLHGSEESLEIMELVAKIPDKTDDLDVNTLRNDVINLHEKKKK
jgi:tetratricopeptide (TPR) repeat protein